jgi:putative ABC transport system permease protein
MLKNYLTVAIRNLLGQKLYTLVNVIGLTIGLTASILLVVYLQYEYSFDRHHENRDRIYRVIRQATLTGGKTAFGIGTSGPLAPAAKAAIPEVEAASHILNRHYQFTVGERTRNAPGCMADSEYLDIFSYELVSGDRAALEEHGTAVITQDLARSLFDEEDPVGRVIHVNYKWWDVDYKVVGLLKDPLPDQRSIYDLRYDFFTIHPPTGRDVMKRMYVEWRPENNFRPLLTWLLLRDGADPDVVEQKLNDLMRQHMGDEVADRDAYHVQPLSDIYLRTLADYDIKHFNYGDIRMVWNLALAALFILAIACSNFVNLSTARAAARAREVGMRKVSGAYRSQLVVQFLGESVLVSVLALLFALIAAHLLIPSFRGFVGRGLPVTLGLDILVSALVVTILTGLSAGIYPALVLSGFQPTQVLKGSVGRSRGDLLRRVLVVLQVAVSVFLVILTSVIEQQSTYMREKDLGFDRDGILMSNFFQYRPDLISSYREVKEDFLSIPGVEKVAACTNPPGRDNTTDRALFAPSGRPEKGVMLSHLGVDEDFLDLFDIELVAGRNFEGMEPPNDSQLILSETAAKRLGWDATSAIGQTLDSPTVSRLGEPVIGVIKDFHHGLLTEPIVPVVLFVRKPSLNQVGKMMMKLSPDSVRVTLEAVKAKWKTYQPTRPFWYWFLDVTINYSYRETDRLIRVFNVSSLLGIFIACLGLLGVVSYATHQRTKEIGVRRVLGATNASLMALIYESPLKLSLIGVGLVTPIAWYVANRWLEDFAFRTTIGIWPFVSGILVALVMGAVSVGLVGLRATRLQPVEALRED